MKRFDFVLPKTGRVLLLLCLFFVLLLSLTACGQETNPYLKSLDVDLTMNADGSVNVVETHVVNFSYRGDEWWNYYKKISLYDEAYKKTSVMSDLTVSVDATDYGVIYKNADDVYSTRDKRDVAGNGYYYDGYRTMEIGVFMPLFSSGTRTIRFSYTLSNVLIAYGTDTVGLYYKFVDESNTLYCEKITAKVHFAEVSTDDVMLWTHIDSGNASGVLPEGATVSYAQYLCEELPAETYLETRLLLPSTGYGDLAKKSSFSASDVEKEETAWQTEYLRKLKIAQIATIVDYVLIAVAVLGAAALVVLAYSKLRPKKRDDAPEYLRDIPKGWTAGECAPLYHYYKNKYDPADAMSATILDLCRRGYIEIKAGVKKKEAEIQVKSVNTDGLRRHEKVVYDLLQETGKSGAFTMKQFEKYAKAHYAHFASRIDEFKRACKGMTEGMGCYPRKNSVKDTFTKIAFGFIFLGLVFVVNAVFVQIIPFFLPYSGGAFIVSGLVMFVALHFKKTPLTDVGQKHYDDFNALGRFMIEFSNMKEHELPQLVLWEEYMVYATAMGIADEVAKQLEIAYPEYRRMVEGYGSTDRYDAFVILYLMSPSVRMRTHFGFASSVRSVTQNVHNLQRQANMVSAAKKFGSGGGSHGGGGFSGGGGGFGGGGMGAR
ncbi:MAG: DUF2207 domain-containing protein [Clostridia bacterium]|nr:DUF2207 domain-containing protein [Clostridia bacterium]